MLNKNLPWQETDHVCFDEQNKILVFMDGVIYNREALLRDLSVSDKEPKDPQLVCKAFLHWGPSFVKRLNGDFAICIYQQNENRAFFFRDHLGIRPLAISRTGQAVYFATDMMGLCKALYGNKKIDPDYLLNQFIWVGYDYDILPHKAVKKVSPAHYHQIDAENEQHIRYWHPESIKKDNKLDADQVKQELESILIDAVNIRADKRFNASAHVSGALDSGVVAALARKACKHQERFFGFSWTPLRAKKTDQMPYDERDLVKKTCAINNITPVFADYGPEDCIQKKEFDWRSSISYLAEKKVIGFARDNKVNLIFSGWGGDEFISIGHRGVDADLIREFDWKYFFKKYPLSRPRKAISALLFNALFPGVLRTHSKYKTYPSVHRYIKKKLGCNIVPRKQRFRYSSRRDVHLQLLSMGHLGQRTADWFVAGRRNGIEYRYPLLDKRIVEYMLKVPSRCLTGGLHYRNILRAIGKNRLPPEVACSKSKEDPVGNAYFVYIAQEVFSSLIEGFEEYAFNPDLDFVDFDLLRSTLPRIIPPGNKDDPTYDGTIFAYLKGVHDFTKAYYAKS